MKLKSLLFGSAAVIAAGTGAQAADLPVAEPVEYVRICDAFGAGFYYIPGTDTCLKVGGQVRVEAHYVDTLDDGDGDDEDIAFLLPDDPELNNFTTRARGNVRLDARTQTDWALVRTFIDFELTVGPGGSSEDSPNYAGTNPALAAAFIQISNDFGTFTAGHTGSFFDFFGSYDFGTRLDIDDNTTEQTLFAYTYGGGNGFSMTLSIEDPASSGRRRSPQVGDYEGQESPDGVANIRVDQGWGSAQVMGVVGQIHDNDPGDGDDEDEIGWAVGAGLSANIPFLTGLEAAVQGGYADGRIGYISVDPGGFGDYNDGPGADDLETTEAWNVRAGVRGSFSETFDASVSGSYTHAEANDFGVDDASEEYAFWAVNGNIRYKPIEGLYMGPEVAYQNIEFEDSDGDADDNGEDDAIGVMFRIQRSF